MDSGFYRRYVTVLLLIVYIFNQTDRAIFGFLMEPIKRELALSDTQLGFLAGPAMVLFYATLGVPIARLADRTVRVTIMSVAIALWSAITTATFAVATFWQFALVRIGVGVGEAGFSAIAQSVIADYHSAKERTRALSIFMLALPLGGVVSSLLAGWVNQAYGWRAVFLVCGVPGIVLAVLLKWTVREPPREVAAAADQSNARSLPITAVVASLWQSRTLRHLAVGQGLVNVLACFLGWFPAFFMRNHHMSSSELGIWLALTTGLGGGVGVWLGGYLTARHGALDDRRTFWIMASATALLMPVIGVALWVPSARLALLMLLPVKALMFFCYGPTFSLVHSLSEPGVRATMASVFILIQVLSGGVLGTQLLGILSDALTPIAGDSGTALRWGMTATSALAVWSSLHFWLASRSIRR
jgi:predicted MFS family arabinose efflux permease